MSGNEIVGISPEVICEMGSGYPYVAINVGAHGNEPRPVEAARRFAATFNEADLVRGSLKIIVANLLALEAGERFIDTDLNRAYPGVSLEDTGALSAPRESLIAHQ